MRAFLFFLGFGRSARLSRMVDRARNVARRAYAPAYGFTGILRQADGIPPPEDAIVGNVRVRMYPGTGTYPGMMRDTLGVPPYRGGWGIPAVLPPAGTLWVYGAACRAERFRPGH